MSEQSYGTIDGHGTYTTYKLPIPGRFLDAIAYLDLETRKVPCSFTFPTGEKLGRRWSAFLAGVATSGYLHIIESAGSEIAFLAGVRTAVGLADTILYRATNSFDEGILKGRYTYARRGLAEVPFYPAMPDAETLTWDRRNKPEPEPMKVRERELDSRYVPEAYERNPHLAMIHLLRDVVELVLAYGEPDPVCESWGRKVITDLAYADEELFGTSS